MTARTLASDEDAASENWPIGIALFEGKVVLTFAEPRNWIKLGKQDALALAELITAKARELP